MRASVVNQVSDLYMLLEFVLASGMGLTIFRTISHFTYVLGWRLAGLGPDWGTGRQGLPYGPGES